LFFYDEKLLCRLGSLFEFLGEFLTQFARRGETIDVRNGAWAKDKRIFDEVSKELKGLKVRFIRPDKVVRDYRANGLYKDAKNAKFPMTNDASGETFPVSVYDYFSKYSPYKVSIQYPNLPCLHVGNPAKEVKHC
jgi:hypothetical protein